MNENKCDPQSRTPSNGSKPTAEAATVLPMQAGQTRADANMHTTAVTAIDKASDVNATDDDTTEATFYDTKGDHNDDDGTTVDADHDDDDGIIMDAARGEEQYLKDTRRLAH